MALFELENGRLIPAQFGHDVPEGFTDDVLGAIRTQVLEIVSRPLFPIAWTAEGRSNGAECSRLTGLDPSGQVVAVEVMRRLDSDVLIESLSRLSDTAALSWADLARTYPLGPEGFRREWVMFREAMPPSPPNGPRLVLVTTEIADEIRPALDVLSTSGIEVHQMALRQMANGRAFLDVEVVGPRVYGHRANTLLETSGVIPVIESNARNRSVVEDKLPSIAEEEPFELEVTEVETPDFTADFRPETEYEDRIEHPADLEHATTAERSGKHGRPSDEHAAATGAIPVAPLAVPPEGAEFRDHSVPTAPGSSHSHSFESETPTRSDHGTPLPSRRTRPTVAPFPSRRSVAAGGPMFHPVSEQTLATKSPDFAAGRPTAEFPSRVSRRRNEHVSPTVASDAALDLTQGLATIASAVGADVPLYLSDIQLSPAGATLSVRGLIRVPSGEYDNPTDALVGEGVETDSGWSAWHLGGPDGPTLADALREIRS